MIASKSLIPGTACVSSITIRNLEESVKRRLRIRAARHGRSMEEEARHILRAALAQNTERPATYFKRSADA